MNFDSSVGNPHFFILRFRIPKKFAVEHLKSEVSNAFDVIIAGVPGKRLASRGTVSVVSFNWVRVEGIWSDFVENLFLF